MSALRPENHVPALDGLRGIAIILVLLSHTSNAGMNLIPGLSMSGAGKFGVWLFFVLSAFLLTRQLLVIDKNHQLTPRMWMSYALRRIFRIYPVYLVFLLSAWLFSEMGLPSRLEWSDVLRHLSLQEGVGHLWSIPVEFKYYLALPLVFAIYVWVCRRHFLLATILVFGIVCAHWMCVSVDDPIALITYLPIFLIGSWSALLLHKLDLNKVGSAVLSKNQWGFLALSILALVFMMTPSIWSVAVAPIPATHWRDSYVLFGVIWSAFVICVLGSGDRFKYVFASKPLKIFGVISFSAYLLHPAIIVFAKKLTTLTGFEQALFVLFFTFVSASISYFIIERPFIKTARSYLVSAEWEVSRIKCNT